jgi:hypothetical protein
VHARVRACVVVGVRRRTLSERERALRASARRCRYCFSAVCPLRLNGGMVRPVLVSVCVFVCVCARLLVGLVYLIQLHGGVRLVIER